MSQCSKKVLLPSPLILGITLVLATRAVAEVPRPSDTRPSDLTSQVAPSPVERKGCVSDYSERTNQGNQPVSRYEFAEGLNACLNQIDQRIDNRRANRATKEELATTKRQLETLRSELERLRMRLDGLDTETKQ